MACVWRMNRCLGKTFRWWSTQIFKLPRVAAERVYKCAVSVIRQIKFMRCFAHNGCNVSVVHVADIRKQMMLDLKVESAYTPRKPPAFVSKI